MQYRKEKVKYAARFTQKKRLKLTFSLALSDHFFPLLSLSLSYYEKLILKCYNIPRLMCAR